MEISTYYSQNREQVLTKAHQFVMCDCGQRVKRGCLSSHRTYSHRHRIWVQMLSSQEATQRPIAVAPLDDW